MKTRFLLLFIITYLSQINLSAQNYLFNQNENGLFLGVGVIRFPRTFSIDYTNNLTVGLSYHGRASAQLSRVNSFGNSVSIFSASIMNIKQSDDSEYPMPVSTEVNVGYVKETGKFSFGASIFRSFKFPKEGYLIIPSFSFARSEKINLYSLNTTLLLKYVFLEPSIIFPKAIQGNIYGFTGGVKAPLNQPISPKKNVEN